MTPRLLILLFILVILVGATLYTGRDQLLKIWLTTITAAPQPPANPFPSPLHAPLDKAGGPLTISGLLATTNHHRTQAGLATLTLNPALTQAANYKLDDMFELAYLDHVSPRGQTTTAIVDSLGYNYRFLGANMALGNFASDAELVQTWLDSPDLRANILSPAYTQTGLAAKPGTFRGKQVWLTVQIFAQPAPPTTESE